MSDMYLRQQDIFDKTKVDTPITVIGAGSLGSWLVLGLAKLGFKDITVFDDDIVELHNIPNQAFLIRDAELGVTKVMALGAIVRQATGVEITMRAERFERQPLSGLVIVTPDNMATRRQVFMRCIDNVGITFFLDGRMGGQTYKVYGVNPNVPAQAQYYLSNWHSDEEGSQEQCTARGVGYNAVMCAMELVNLAKRHVMGQDVPRSIITDAMGMWREVYW